MLRDLLARTHGDGGHYVEQHGLEKAAADADILIADWRAQMGPKKLTDEQIDRIAENCAKSMPDGIRGFCNTWGWRQFARELLDICAGHERDSGPSGSVSNIGTTK